MFAFVIVVTGGKVGDSILFSNYKMVGKKKREREKNSHINRD